jgi:hypothetical protein
LWRRQSEDEDDLKAHACRAYQAMELVGIFTVPYEAFDR